MRSRTRTLIALASLLQLSLAGAAGADPTEDFLRNGGHLRSLALYQTSRQLGPWVSMWTQRRLPELAWSVARELEPPPRPPSRKEATFLAMSSRMNRVGNRAAHAEIQAARRAGLEEYRKQVRVLTPEAFARAREAAREAGDDFRVAANQAAQEVYARGEAEAMEHASRAYAAAREKYLAQVEERLVRIQADYRAELEAEARKLAIRVLLREYRRKGPDRANRAHNAAQEALDEAQSQISARVAKRVADARQVELDRAENEALQAGLAEYREREEWAYRDARNFLDRDDPAASLPGTSGAGEDEAAGAPDSTKDGVPTEESEDEAPDGPGSYQAPFGQGPAD